MTLMRERSKPMSCAALFAILVLAAAAFGCGGNYGAERVFWKAEKLSKALSQDLEGASPEAFEEAIRAYERVVNDAPGTHWAARAQIAVGSLYGMQKRFIEAREAYTRVLVDHPETGELALTARYAIAKILEIEKDFDGMLAMYQEIAEHHPHSALGMHARIYAGQVHENRLKESQKAKVAYSQMVEEVPENPMTQQAKFRLEHLGLAILPHAPQPSSEGL